MEDVIGVDCQKGIRRAMATLRLAQEILAGLVVPCAISIKDMLRDRAEARGSRLTETELEVMSRFIEGRSAEEIAEERELPERTISNQLRSGCHKLGFSDRRELKGWGAAVSRFVLAKPPEDEPRNE